MLPAKTQGNKAGANSLQVPTRLCSRTALIPIFANGIPFLIPVEIESINLSDCMPAQMPYALDPARPITTLTIFRFPKKHTWWAFAQMGLRTLENPGGAIFSKMLGNGRNGFDIFPDFQQYTFLVSWKNTASADTFFNSSNFQNYASRTSEHYTIRMIPLQSHGQWDGHEPFDDKESAGLSTNGPLVVLTRAKINFTKLLDFWRHVRKAHVSLRNSGGVMLALGIGENPFTQQATISIWDSVASLRKFAYQQSGHKEIVKRTRQRQWYKEELFARFVPVATQGTLNGKDVLEGYVRGEVLS
jgi:heme-degrading monooxygenase HmoA